ncbi:unnamed protein product [Cladocopium goreaui]|uniref:C3H1-type domain-containing protein n=1 Tax=Cladocopium goreaui TaxID=2562237 RepID=A0A9P1DA87_9DINO|nr:unnamed protein product [Cladocopium goreaui]
MGTLGVVLPPLIKELAKRLDQVETGIDQNEVLTRQEFAQACWKIGRTVRQLIKPDYSEERGILWHECKGALKQVLVIEKFQPGVFMDNCVRSDVVEKDLAEMLRRLVTYLKKRQSGAIHQPIEKEEARERPAESQDEEKGLSKGKGKDKGKDKGKGKGKGKSKEGEEGGEKDKEEKDDKNSSPWKKRKWTGSWNKGQFGESKSDWWSEDINLGTTVSDFSIFEESDPEQECPDKAKFGSCSYGKQCGFCFR